MVDNIQSQEVSNVKYLHTSMWLKRPLKWTKRINELYQKAYKVLNLLKVLSSSLHYPKATNY